MTCCEGCLSFFGLSVSFSLDKVATSSCRVHFWVKEWAVSCMQYNLLNDLQHHHASASMSRRAPVMPSHIVFVCSHPSHTPLTHQ
jgi:hypothetical protein